MPLDIKELVKTILDDLKDNDIDSELEPTSDQLMSGLDELIKQGLLNLTPFTKVNEAALNAVKAAVEKVQSNSNGLLKLDRLFGVKTLTWLQFASRCANRLKNKWKTDPATNPREKIPSDVQFGHLEIRYFVVDPLPVIPGEDSLLLLHKVWKSWGDVCGMVATQTPNQRTANVLIRSRNIDGPSNILADADVGPPPGNRILELHIDKGEIFDTAFKFEATMAHEIGHLLGLDHTSAPGQLMGPRLSTFKAPQKEDIDRVRSIGWGLPHKIIIFPAIDESQV